MRSPKKPAQFSNAAQHHPDEFAILVPASTQEGVQPGAALVLQRQSWDALNAGTLETALAYYCDRRFEVLPFRELVLRAADYCALRHPTTRTLSITNPAMYRVVGFYRRNEPRCDILDPSALVSWGVPAKDLLAAA